MGNAGYGNHEPPPVSARGGADPNAASQKPPASSQDRPAMDGGGVGDLSPTSGQMGASGSQPNPAGQGPRTDNNTDETRAPGTGALGTNPQGDEVDPGTS
jgi:hypothetical protein